jgi:hypothetical protein
MSYSPDAEVRLFLLEFIVKWFTMTSEAPGGSVARPESAGFLGVSAALRA